MDNRHELAALDLAQWTEEYGVLRGMFTPDKSTQNAITGLFNPT